MHHFIYPSRDTFITNQTGLDGKNFGLTEILQVGTQNTTVETLNQTQDFLYNNVIINQSVNNFTGTFSGSLALNNGFAFGNISGSNLVLSSSYFSGSVDGVAMVYSGSLGNSPSGSRIIGLLSGSLIAPQIIGFYDGILSGSNGYLNGIANGIDIQNTPNWTSTTSKFVQRALLAFDLSAISKSIVSGAITSASFNLKLKISQEENLPISYTVYALPISQSWNVGDGYLSDGGSDSGASWHYDDNNYGTPWYPLYITTPRPAINFINNPSLVTASFSYGGGTFYTSSWCSQSFNYQSSDIDMDITSMVTSWLNGNIPNNGLMLIHSDELQSTGSGFLLNFFSRDTNTIYSPTLDVAWDDVSSLYSTGSIFTGSSTIASINAGINTIATTGSTINVNGGLSGIFTASAAILITPNYVTTASSPINQALDNVSGSFSGSINGYIDYFNGILVGTAILSASYFNGIIDGISRTVSGSVSGSVITGSISGSILTFDTAGAFSGSISASTSYFQGTFSGSYLDPNHSVFNGFVSGSGTSGSIAGESVFGLVTGLISNTTQSIYLPNETITTYADQSQEAPYVSGYDILNASSPYNDLIDLGYTWIGDSGWSSDLPILPIYPFTCSCGPTYTVQTMVGSFTSGFFSGSVFTAYYSNYQIIFANLTGSWNNNTMYGTNITFPIPSGIDPYTNATVNGPYLSGNALGIYNIFSNSSASFVGQMTSGQLIGSSISAQLTGSVYTSSYAFTSSVNMTSSVLNALDTTRPFVVTLQNVNPTYKAGDIVKIGVFGRQQYPLKNFVRTTQQQQYLIPEYLPTSSYYALKDNMTGEIVMDFDSYTQIGCNYPYGNYFMLDTTSLPQERYYTILIRVEDSLSSYTIDTGKIFKITR